MASVGFVGVIVIDTRVAGVTVTEVVPKIPDMKAEMVPLPVAVAVIRPFASMVTIPAGTPQLTDFVRFCVDPSVYVPVAVSCRVVPFASEGFGGVIVIAVRVAAVTVTGVESESPP